MTFQNKHIIIIVLYLFVITSAAVATDDTLTREQYWARIDSIRAIEKARIDSLTKKARNSLEYQLLTTACETNSDTLKQAFFDLWLDASDSIRAKKQELSEIEVDLYALYNDIFVPKKSSQYKKYLVIQDMLPYSVYADSSYEKVIKQSFLIDTNGKLLDSLIQPFVPQIQYKNKTVLILTEHFDLLINEFLKESWKSPVFFTSEGGENFLIREIPLVMSHWDIWYHLVTFPKITNLILNQTSTKAKVYYRSTYCTGGSTEYIKVNGTWKRTKHSPTQWIE